MEIITLLDELDIIQDGVIDGLDAALRERGSAKALAEKAEISSVFISYIRNRKRMPSIETAKRISRALPISPPEQKQWMGYVELYWELREKGTSYTTKKLRDAKPQLVSELSNVHHQALFCNHPDLAASMYKTSIFMGEEIKQEISPTQDPISYLEVITVLNNAYSVVNRKLEALNMAKQMGHITQVIDFRQYPKSRERLEHLAADAFHAQIVSLNNLGLPKKALELVRKKEVRTIMKNNPHNWNQHFLRCEMKAISRLPRFSIKEINELAHKAINSIKKSDTPDRVLQLPMAKVSLARARLRYGDTKGGLQILESVHDDFYAANHRGPLHEMIFLKALVQACKLLGAHEDGNYWYEKALIIGQSANLTHQLELLERTDVASI